jgi:hypothetical protein
MEGAGRTHDAKGLAPLLGANPRVDDKGVAHSGHAIEHERRPGIEPRTREERGRHPQLVQIGEIERLEEAGRAYVGAAYSVEGGYGRELARHLEPGAPIGVAVPGQRGRQSGDHAGALGSQLGVPAPRLVEAEGGANAGNECGEIFHRAQVHPFSGLAVL